MDACPDPRDLSPDLGVSVVGIVSAPLGIELETAGAVDLDDIRCSVAARVRQILDDHFERLPHILYLFDVDEVRVKEAFVNVASGDLHEEIARLIVERSVQRVHSRRAYRNGRKEAGETIK